MKKLPLRLFYSYAHEDIAARETLDQHLELLIRKNVLVRWHDRQIVPGRDWHHSIAESLETADIIVFLVSKAFLDSEFVRDHEIPMAMAQLEKGRARVVPILLEPPDGWEKQAFAKLEVLPTKGLPISKWSDPVAAYADAVRGIGRAVRDVIVEGGGAFEFSCHEFTEAELSALEKSDRKRALDGLARLRAELNRTVPFRRFEENLLIATWELRRFGDPSFAGALPPESLFHVAQIVSALDLVVLQEVDRDLRRFEALLAVLGPEWGYLVSDVAPPARQQRTLRRSLLQAARRVPWVRGARDPAAGAPRGRGAAVLQLSRPPSWRPSGPPAGTSTSAPHTSSTAARTGRTWRGA